MSTLPELTRRRCCHETAFFKFSRICTGRKKNNKRVFWLCSLHIAKRRQEGWRGVRKGEEERNALCTLLLISGCITAAPLFAGQVCLLHPHLYHLEKFSLWRSQIQDPSCIPPSLTSLSPEWWFSITFTCFSHSQPWTFPHATTSAHTFCCLVLSLILHNSYSHTPTHLLLPPGPQPWPDQAIPTVPCTSQKKMKPKLKVPSFSVHLCFAHWNTQFDFQIADNQWLHLLHFASQSLTNTTDENLACPI